MAKVLVTGAGGFIGSHLTEELVRQGEEVRAFVRYNSRDDRGLLEELPNEIRSQVEVVMGDLKDPEAVRKAVKGCSKIFHLGALSPFLISMFIPSTSCRQTSLALRTFSTPALRMRAWRRSSTPPPVKSTEQPLHSHRRETSAASPISLFGEQDCRDKLAESYFLSFNLPVATLRP